MSTYTTSQQKFYQIRVLKLLMDFVLYILRQQKDPCKAHRITLCKTKEFILEKEKVLMIYMLYF